ncbi:MAG: outer membrane beta-barrel protein [Gammaproteobacteria bacterium]
MSDKQRASDFSFALITLVLVGYYEMAVAQTATEQLGRDQRAAIRPRPERGETVTNRPRLELDPLGVRAGSFLIYPRLGLQEFYNDNIFATDSGATDDFITLVSPRVDVVSDWTNHAFDLYANAAIGRHVDQTGEDFEDFSVGTNGRLDITQRANLRAGVSYDRLHEGRGSPDDVRRQSGSPAVEPTLFDVGSVFLTYHQTLGPFLLESGGAVDRLGYDNVGTEDGGIIINDDRDRAIIAGRLKMGYEFIPGYTAFARGEVDYRRYDNLCCGAVNQVDRDSQGYLIEVGTDLDVTAVLFGNVAIGYRSQDYDDPSFDTIGDVAGRASLTWNPTGLTTVSASITRGDVIETTVSGSAAIFETAGRVTLDHELLRNLLLQAAVSVSDDDYQDIDRSDTYVRAGFGAKYLMNRYIHLDLGYEYLSLGSSAQGEDFTNNTIFLGALVRI